MPDNTSANSFQVNSSSNLNTHSDYDHCVNGISFPNQPAAPDLFVHDSLFGFMEEPSAFSQLVYSR